MRVAGTPGPGIFQNPPSFRETYFPATYFTLRLIGGASFAKGAKGACTRVAAARDAARHPNSARSSRRSSAWQVGSLKRARACCENWSPHRKASACEPLPRRGSAEFRRKRSNSCKFAGACPPRNSRLLPSQAFNLIPFSMPMRNRTVLAGSGSIRHTSTCVAADLRSLSTAGGYALVSALAISLRTCSAPASFAAVWPSVLKAAKEGRRRQVLSRPQAKFSF